MDAIGERAEESDLFAHGVEVTDVSGQRVFVEDCGQPHRRGAFDQQGLALLLVFEVVVSFPPKNGHLG